MITTTMAAFAFGYCIGHLTISIYMGLKKSNAVAAKQKQELAFQEKVNKAGKQAEYGNLLADFKTNYQAIAPYALSRDYFVEIVLRNTELLNVSYKMFQLTQLLETKGEQAFTDRKANLIKGLPEFYKDFNAGVDEKVFEQLMNL